MMICEKIFEQLLQDSISEVFETMLFMSVRQDATEKFSPNEDSIAGVITYQNEKIQGTLSLLCSREYAEYIAASMLGSAPQTRLTEGEILGSISEVCNVIIGRVKLQIIDSFGEIHIGIPSVSIGMPEEISNANQLSTTLDLFIDECFTVKVSLSHNEK